MKNVFLILLDHIPSLVILFTYKFTYIHSLIFTFIFNCLSQKFFISKQNNIFSLFKKKKNCDFYHLAQSNFNQSYAFTHHLS